MAGQDLPIWIHPMRGPHFSDYASEDHSESEIWFTFGWPYETSACVTRLIFSRLFDKLPNLKIITHHMGGMIPYFADKIGLGFTQIFQGATTRESARRARRPQKAAARLSHALRRYGAERFGRSNPVRTHVLLRNRSFAVDEQSTTRIPSAANN